MWKNNNNYPLVITNYYNRYFRHYNGIYVEITHQTFMITVINLVKY
jgi:hypothetical protein